MVVTRCIEKGLYVVHKNGKVVGMVQRISKTGSSEWEATSRKSKRSYKAPYRMEAVKKMIRME